LSPGWDYLIIHNLPKGSFRKYGKIYNNILRARVFSDNWKKCRTFSIPKNYKTNEKPVSLASHTCKVLE
jgi:hypothetical protein